MALYVQKVDNRIDLRTFIRLPYKLYKNDRFWVPPLLTEEKKKYQKKSNPILARCEVQLFVLFDNGRPAGRISAFIDPLAVENWKKPVGLFGSFECMDNDEGASLLLKAAQDWLKERRMEIMRGPWSFTSQEFGIVIKGCTATPMVMAPYNPSYYNRQMEIFGLKKAKDLCVYEMDASNGYELPERFLRHADRVKEKYQVSIRPINMKRLKEDVKIITDIGNASTSGNWGYIPVTDEEAGDLARSLKPVVDPDIIFIAEVEGEPIGYMIAFPDLNVILKKLNGRLLPFGIFKLMIGIRHIHQYRIWGLGIIPSFLRKAIDTLFYRELYEVLSAREVTRVEANYVLEDNMVMNNPILKMGFQLSKKYRVYERDI